MARPKLIDEGTGTPLSLRLQDEMKAQLEETAKRLKMPLSEVMRLGLIDLNACRDVAEIIQQVATDKGESFLAWSRTRQVQTDPIITEDLIEAGGAALRLLSADKTLTSQSYKAAAKLPACQTQNAASPAISTATGPKKKPLPKPPANVAQLPTSHWGSTDTRAAETPAPAAASPRRKTGTAED
jgi:hypothetical protein